MLLVFLTPVFNKTCAERDRCTDPEPVAIAGLTELLLRSSSAIPHIDYSAQDQSFYLTRNSDACGFRDLARALYRLMAGDARGPKVPSVCDTHAALHWTCPAFSRLSRREPQKKTRVPPRFHLAPRGTSVDVRGPSWAGRIPAGADECVSR